MPSDRPDDAATTARRSAADDPAQAIARALLAGFDKHYALFRECARAAKRHFEAGHFLAIGHVARDRIDFYDRRVAETAERVRRDFAAVGLDGADAEALWARVKRHYVAMLAEHRQPECAETFFNTVSCKLLARDYFHNRAMFVRPAVATEYLDADLPAYRSYYPRERGLRAAVIDLILDFRLERRFADFRRDLANLLRAFRTRLPRPLRLDANFQIQVLSGLFFRNRSAYIVGRIVNGVSVVPFAVPIRHAPGGALYVDALLADPVDLALLFSANRAYFLVDMEVPSATVEFLRSILPDKTAAELYTIVGLQKHGKTLFFRDFLAHLRHSTDRFENAPGIRGLVMAVFTLPSYPYVFKIIKDRIAPSKDTDRAKVAQKYALVKHHDRAGRMTDILEYSDVMLPRARFAPGLVEELVDLAPSQVEEHGDWVRIRHVYIERRLKPLNLVLEGADALVREHAIAEYGQAIRDLAAVNIFAGDLLYKNFGQTRYGRVVFYDYDEIEYMTDCSFRKIPAPPPGFDDCSGEVWYRVGPKDVFPEEFATFLLTDPDVRDAFLRHHADLLEADWWRGVQQSIREHGAAEVLWYPERLRFAPPVEARRKQPVAREAPA
ncbi:MAG: bifunctional isocitrate dehydrogenase kinase/phosphatase [Burkholderiales bacterium]|jgi:isocitrate dehydrogenase kinase/phosphatase|nr:bifunctional isocitrate dehydrogenase kinase/phosphatase [Burkholderiales bacterium]